MSCGGTNDEVLVIGFGNPLRGDDGVGWHAAQRIEAAFPQGRVRVLTVHQLLPELAEDASRSALLILIDASVDDAPGTWRRREVAPAASGGIDAHSFGPEELLACARELFGRCPPAVLYTVGAEDLGLGERLSTGVERAVAEMCACIIDELRK